MSVRSHSHAVFTLLLCIPAQRTRSNGVFAQHLRPSEGWIASAPGEVHRGVGKTARRYPWWKPSLSYLVPWTGTSRSSLASDHLNWLGWRCHGDKLVCQLCVVCGCEKGNPCILGSCTAVMTASQATLAAAKALPWATGHAVVRNFKASRVVAIV